MAVAGMQNVSAFGHSFFGEPRSPVSRGCSDGQGRASSLLQMWRELEGDHIMSSPRPTRQENEDNISEGSDEIENRDARVSEMEHDDKNSMISEQSSDLGEIERERVRQTFREWIDNGGKNQSVNGFRPGPQLLGENERGRVRIIREWVQMTTQQKDNSPRGDRAHEVGSQIEQVRDGLEINGAGGLKPIRRICGRQTLLDLLLRAQTERKQELFRLSEQKRVSDFSHRNRIQALLRGRFLRNERMIPEQKPSCRAVTELGQLAQRSTVSDLREGFISRLDSAASTISNISEADFPSNNETNDQSEPTPREAAATEIFVAQDLETAADRTRDQHEFVEVSDESAHIKGIEQSPIELESNHHTEEQLLHNESSEQEELTDCPTDRNDEAINATITNDSLWEADEIVHSGSSPHEVSFEHYELRLDSQNADETTDHSNELDRSITEEFICEVISVEGDELNRPNTIDEDTQNNDIEEAIDSWLDMPSEGDGSAVGIAERYYFPDNEDYDEDTVQGMELRELVSRGRVSSLLGSSFRHSLDQVLLSHAERLGHATDDLDFENNSHEIIEQDQVQQINDETDETEFDPVWPDDFEDANWSHDVSNQQYGTEWEIINGLRIDMATLQQRMNNMQNMLEECMEMQVELQRTVRQEVSAALNRPTFSKDIESSKSITHQDESNWDQVRKGICCLCSDSKIDSLLYRCGHMCTCSKCAEGLVKLKGKCPMCQAPVVEMVRAYFANS